LGSAFSENWKKEFISEKIGAKQKYDFSPQSFNYFGFSTIL